MFAKDQKKNCFIKTCHDGDVQITAEYKSINISHVSLQIHLTSRCVQWEIAIWQFRHVKNQFSFGEQNFIFAKQIKKPAHALPGILFECLALLDCKYLIWDVYHSSIISFECKSRFFTGIDCMCGN